MAAECWRSRSIKTKIMTPPTIGILEGRLTPTRGRGIQFFPDGAGEWEKEFESAQAAGLGAIELLVRGKGLYEHPLMSDAGRARLQELSRVHGIALPSVHGYYSIEDQYANNIADIVDATDAIGAKVILISFFNERKLSPVLNETWTHAHTQLKEAARRAKAKGIKLGIEAELPAETLLAFIAEAETPEVFGVYYDLGNQFSCGFPVVDELKLLDHRVVGIHVKDRLPSTLEHEGVTVPLGEGNADFTSAFYTLKNIGYSSPIILQTARTEEGAEVSLASNNRMFVQKILADVW